MKAELSVGLTSVLSASQTPFHGFPHRGVPRCAEDLGRSGGEWDPPEGDEWLHSAW